MGLLHTSHPRSTSAPSWLLAFATSPGLSGGARPHHWRILLPTVPAASTAQAAHLGIPLCTKAPFPRPQHRKACSSSLGLAFHTTDSVSTHIPESRSPFFG